MKRLIRWRKYVQKNWRLLASWLAIIAVPLILFGWQLKTLTHGASHDELAYIHSVDSGQKLLATPAFLAHRLLTYGLLKLGVETIVWFRVISVGFGFLAACGMFYILYNWYSKRVALIGSFLFVSSSLVLHTSRSALPESSYLLFLPIVAIGIWLQKTKRFKRALAILTLCLTMTPFIPGFVWLAIAVWVRQGKRLLRALLRAPWTLKIFCVLVILTGLAPLAYILFLHPLEALSVVGLPTSLLTPSQYLLHIRDSVLALGWQYNTASASSWVAGTPIFEVFSAAMIVLGIYSLRFEHKLKRARLQMGVTILFGVLILLHGPVTFAALAGPAYLLVAGGLAFMLQQWFTVFPRNPFARALAVALVTVSVLGTGYYHSYRYFTAWPQNADTKTAFTSQNLVK